MLEWNPSQRCELQNWIASSSALLTLRSNPICSFCNLSHTFDWSFKVERLVLTYIGTEHHFLANECRSLIGVSVKSLCVNTSLFVLSSGGKNETQKFLHRSQSNIRAWLEAERVRGALRTKIYLYTTGRDILAFLFSRKSKKIIEYCCIFPFVVVKYKSCMENTKN